VKGHGRTRSGNYDEAIAAYQRAIALLPEFCPREQYKLKRARTARELSLTRKRR